MKNVFYVVENNANGAASLSMDMARLQTSMVNTAIINGFHVRRTDNIDETIRFFVQMTQHLEAMCSVRERAYEK